MIFISQKKLNHTTASLINTTYLKLLLPRQFISKPLKTVCKLISDGARRILWLGGVRSLKTSSVMQLCGWWATGISPPELKLFQFKKPVNIIVAAQKYDLIREIVQKYLISEVDTRPPDLWFCTRAPKKPGIDSLYEKIHVPHFTNSKYDGDSVISFRSWSEGDRAFRGLNAIDVIFCDEEPTHQIHLEFCRRLAGMHGRQTFLIYTMWPDFGKTELIDFFMMGRDCEEIKDGVVYLKSGWHDNPFMPEIEKQRLRAAMPAWKREAAEFGTPTFGVGRVFDFDINSILVDKFDVPAHFRVIGGVDPAATYNGTWGGCVLAVDPETQKIYLIREYLRDKLTFPEHAQLLENMGWYGMPFVCDPGGGGEDTKTRMSASDWLKNIYHLKIHKADKVSGIKERAIGFVYENVRLNKFYIFRSCTKAIEEFSGYSRDDSGKIVKQNDHIIDAVLYAINRINLAKSIHELQNSSNNIGIARNGLW